ncbi:male-enhanced antigen 1-like [Plakobranchus ocellatus]|uniref:Male-enhanced antigen 1 n=1 Tax=Plakobranchus ocellatus TaxID=259542 RepID=A0AAV4AY87_9GAST|nr:male-enhanced antigen 1-like [Plakobranchus ocellatus]
MAPVPKDTNKPQEQNNMDESGLNSLHDSNLTVVDGDSDTSEEEYDSNMIAPGGYSLLPSEPGHYQEDSDSDNELAAEPVSNSLGDTSEPIASSATVSENFHSETLPDAVLSSEAVSSDLRVQDSEDVSNPAAPEKLKPAKIPSYMQVPSLPRNKEGHLWNEKRQGGKRQTLDKGHESAILKAMSGFQLPPESIPAWAKNIPEDQWRQQVHSHIVSYTSNANTEDQGLASAAEKSDAGIRPDQDWVAEFPEDM